jgi:hypothetical protein
MDFIKLARRLDGTTLTKPASGNQRAYADLLEEHACTQASLEHGSSYAKGRSVRSPEDFSLDLGTRYLIDVKTRRLNTQFNMPNLISVDRLDRILSDPTQDLWYWLIDYEVMPDGRCMVRYSEIRAVWSLPLDALAIQNLGKGQLQIKDWTKLGIHRSDRDGWLRDMRRMRKAFYLKQVDKFRKMAESISI